MLARHLTAALAETGRSRPAAEAVVLGRRALDITDGRAVDAAFAAHRPRVVVNCAAFTDVDGAESRWAEAMRVNGGGPRLLARRCARHGVRLIHVSTDYVFPGDTRSPYGESDAPGPRTVYGRSKLAGERAVLSLLPDTGTVVRTAWLYGGQGRSFVRTMLERAPDDGHVDVVNDQWGQPTWAGDVARLLVTLARTPPDRARGIFHATNAGAATWYELAREVFRLAGADPERVRPVATADRPGPAPRPACTVLGHDRWRLVGVAPPRDWRAALREAMRQLLPGGRLRNLTGT
ncbi:dTDP-4-dehydrorhamnose reductase [Streptomyces nogalater]|nr:putative dTDP-4-dehydrorhamnose reductase [Streptomyces nogalater]WBU77269.1 SnogC [Cosmid vector pSnogaori_NGS]